MKYGSSNSVIYIVFEVGDGNELYKDKQQGTLFQLVTINYKNLISSLDFAIN